MAVYAIVFGFFGGICGLFTTKESDFQVKTC